ncbi:MAG: DUF2076 family protein, partial [Variovorax sp.]
AGRRCCSGCHRPGIGLGRTARRVGVAVDRIAPEARFQSALQEGRTAGVDRDAYTPGRPAQPDARAMAPAAAPAPGWRERLFGGGAPAAPAPAGSGSGFLGQAASAAAGVAGGMFLFNGIEHLMRGGQGGSGGGGGFLGLGGGGAGGGTPEVVENVTQNFYGDGARGNDDGNGDVGRLADDAGADWSGFDDGTSFDDDRFV